MEHFIDVPKFSVIQNIWDILRITLQKTRVRHFSGFLKTSGREQIFFFEIFRGNLHIVWLNNDYTLDNFKRWSFIYIKYWSCKVKKSSFKTENLNSRLIFPRYSTPENTKLIFVFIWPIESSLLSSKYVGKMRFSLKKLKENTIEVTFLTSNYAWKNF